MGWAALGIIAACWGSPWDAPQLVLMRVGSRESENPSVRGPGGSSRASPGRVSLERVCGEGAGESGHRGGPGELVGSSSLPRRICRAEEMGSGGGPARPGRSISGETQSRGQAGSWGLGLVLLGGAGGGCVGEPGWKEGAGGTNAGERAEFGGMGFGHWGSFSGPLWGRPWRVRTWVFVLGVGVQHFWGCSEYRDVGGLG